MSSVAPGTGWPDDPATAATPVARTPAEVRHLAAAAADARPARRRGIDVPCLPAAGGLARAGGRRQAPSFADETYWGRPIAGWGDEQPKVLIVGLAPAAHGGNRTGRIFTGDRSGDWLFAALHRVGLAKLPTSTHAGDGQQLIGARMVAAVRCAPPANKPTPTERDTCSPWLLRELELVAGSVRSIVVLGAFGWQALMPRARGNRSRRSAAAAEVRAWRRGRADPAGRRPGEAARLLSPQSAEHVHRQAHRADD